MGQVLPDPVTVTVTSVVAQQASVAGVGSAGVGCDR